MIYLSDIQCEPDLEDWPEIAAVVRAKVKPERERLGGNPNNIPLKRRWWAYQAHRPELYAALSTRSRVLATSQTAKYLTFVFLPTGWIYSQKLNIFLLDAWQDFALLQSRVHESWARVFGSTMKDDPVYTPTDCFETFAFPSEAVADAALGETGRTYYEIRAQRMVHKGEGLTQTYNRFHDPDERDPDILNLRELHEAMDRAVLDAYGWADIQPKCEFLLDYEDEEDEPGDDGGKKKAKKKPWRYRWPDAIRDEVLARLLALNQERAKEEARVGARR